MGGPIALVICSIGIAGLFFLDRDKSARTSKALWLPVVWLWIVGSRNVSAWLGIGGAGGQGSQLNATLDGSPADAYFFAVLLAVGIVVLLQRRNLTSALLKLSGPILVYYFYCLASVAWSPFPDPAFKRWTKYVGDLVMVLIVLTDLQPLAAIRRIFSRVGFLILPLSVAFIRYTPMGRGYDPSGDPANIGVTLNKNALGLITFLILIGALWNLRALLADKTAQSRGRRLVAQGTLFVFGLAVLQMAQCATATACAVLGCGLLLATGLPALKNRPARLHALVLTVVLAGSVAMFLGGESVVTSALGRNSDLTGRTEIWAASIAAAQNPVIGSGFESFWNANNAKVARALPGYWDLSNLVTAHNGYIEVYLNLGWMGVCLIALILISGYLRAAKAYQRNPEVGGLFLAYIATAIFYSITEAGFRVLTPSWIFLLLAIVGATGVSRGVIALQELGRSPKPTAWLPTKFARRTAPSAGVNIPSDLTALRRS
jgi:O-antigen ligase